MALILEPSLTLEAFEFCKELMVLYAIKWW